LPYTPDVVADSNFISKGSTVEIIIEKLGTIDWNVQKPAFSDFKNLTPNTIDKNIQFLLGRNILQVANGDVFSAIDYFENLGRNIQKWSINGENHLLNGILYEIYFDSNGRLRQGYNFKSSLLEKVCLLEEDIRYKSSFDFINKQLQPLKDYLFYIPSSRPVNLPLELTFTKQIVNDFGSEITYFKLNSIKYQDNEILNIKDGTIYQEYTYKNFIHSLCLDLSIPKNRLTLSNNFDGEIEYVKYPWNLKDSLLKN
ncbi:MAG: caspase family protein, partial [Bacteroidales bacterium]|nr:caspase family protein [Bacteroidales bacterium]